MDGAGNQGLREAIRVKHGCDASFRGSELVHVSTRGGRSWDGEVTIFDVDRHPSGARRCYAWTRRTRAGKTRYYAVLELDDVIDATSAVATAFGSR